LTTSSYVTNRGLKHIINGAFVPGTTTIKALLITTEVAYSTGSDLNTVADFLGVASETTATGYSRATLASGAVSEDDANNRAAGDFADVSWGSIGGATNTAIAQMLVYIDGANDAARDVVLVCGSTGLPQNTNGGTFTTSISDLYRATCTPT
jgi:hypothetical protein